MDSLLSIRMTRNEIPFHDTFSHFYHTPSSSTERGGGENREIMRWWASERPGCSKGLSGEKERRRGRGMIIESEGKGLKRERGEERRGTELELPHFAKRRGRDTGKRENNI